MRISTVSWCSLVLGTVVALAANTHPAEAKSKHSGSSSAPASRTKAFTEHGSSRVEREPAGRAKLFVERGESYTRHFRSASEHGRGYAFGGLPVVFHPGGNYFGGSAVAGRYQFIPRGGRMSLQNAVYYTSRFKQSLSKTGKARFAMRGGKYHYSFVPNEDSIPDGGSLQCVPFARAASGIELKGNAADWWDAAAGVYQRGETPEPGSVLNFRSTGGMRLGHVAVVSAVVGAREIEVDHANWANAGAFKGGVARGVHVIDVSPDNDWSAVRVALGETGGYGSVYPTYGFIYDRPDNGTTMASARSGLHRNVRFGTSEVAEAPER